DDGGLILQASDERLSSSVAARLTQSGAVFRAGECPELEIDSGPRTTAGRLNVWVYVPGGAMRQAFEVAIPASSSLQAQRVRLPCSGDGPLAIGFGDAGAAIDTTELRHISYDVIDSRASGQENPASRTLVEEIDLAAKAPDFSGGEASRIVNAPLGRYRESGSAGWLPWQTLPAPVKALRPAPSWFAYALQQVTPQLPHVVEIDY